MSDSASPVESPDHDAPFVYHLLALHHASRTGVMTVRADSATTDIYLKQGTPVFADKNTLAGSLGRTLLADGVLSEAQYEAVIARMTEELFESEQMRFAEVAMTLGFVSHEQVHTRLEQQVKSAVVACMAPQQPRVSFRPCEEAVSPVANYPCPVQPLVLAGVKSYYDLVRARAVWGPDALAFAELCLPADETAALYALQPAERRYIRHIDGSRSIEELTHTGVLDELHASQVLVALLLTDGVRLYQERRGARAQSHPEALESDSARRRLSSPLLRAVQAPIDHAGAPPDPRAAAPTPMPTAPPKPPPHAAPPKPSPHAAPPKPAVPPQAAPPKPASPPKPPSATTSPRAAVATPSALEAEPVPPGSGAPSRHRAETLFTQGKRFYKAGNQARALRAFAGAVAQDPSCPEYALYERWARFLLEPPQRADEVLVELDQLALDTIRRDKTNGFAFYVHGRVAQARGNFETARQGLKTALKLDPGNLEAKTFLRALTKR